MQLEIITPDKTIYSGEVSSATFPGVKGSFQVLNNHAPVISSLSQGLVKYQDETGEGNIEVTGGVVEVKENKIVLLAESVLV
jgi:F-type H+-transporting ATPase subunit epsilon